MKYPHLCGERSLTVHVFLRLRHLLQASIHPPPLLPPPCNLISFLHAVALLNTQGGFSFPLEFQEWYVYRNWRLKGETQVRISLQFCHPGHSSP